MKKILIILLISCFGALKIQANNEHRDTIRLILPNNVMIDQLVYYRKTADTDILKELKKNIQSFLNDFNKLETEELSEKHPIKFTYTIGNGFIANSSITFTDYRTPTTILFTQNETNKFKDGSEKEELIIKKRTHLLEIIKHVPPHKFKSSIHFNSLDQLDALLAYDFEEINENLQTLMDKDKSYKGKPFITYIRINEDNQPEVIKTDYPNKRSDVLQLSAGSGLQNLKGDWLGSFSTQATMILARKGMDKHAFSFSYEWLYNFTTPNERFINEFIDLGYAYNFSKSPGNDSWVGLSFGFMTNRRGDFFANNSYRLGLNTRLNKHLTVGPEMYFNDFFKNVYPGINVTITVL